MEPSLDLSAKMVLCEAELKRIRSGRLKGMSVETSKGFKCIHSNHGNKVNRGTFKTIEACNAQFDNCEIKRDIENVRQRLRSLGYQKSTTGKTVKYVVKLESGFKSYDTPEQARAKFEEVIENEVKKLEAQIKPIDKSDIVKV
jgi:hypothetical protein